MINFAASFTINLPKSAFDIKPENIQKFMIDDPCLEGCILFCYQAIKLANPVNGQEENMIQVTDLCMTLILSAITKTTGMKSTVITSIIKEIHSITTLIKA